MKLLRRLLAPALLALAVAAPAAPADAAALSPRTVATGLRSPWDMAFLPDGRALITERDSGRVRMLSRSHRLARTPVGRIPVRHDDNGENGLLGIAVDPQFRRNHFVYLYAVRSLTEGRLLRYTLRGGRLRQQHVVFASIPAGKFHNGGRVRFGPDGFLYLSTGETARRPSWAQDPSSLAGKVLRTRGFRSRTPVTPEVFTLGHRNVQGLAWQPGTGRLFATEMGEDSSDEINLLEQGRNYGWPAARGAQTADGRFTGAFVDFGSDVIAPSGATFVRRPGSKWTGDLLVTALVGEQLRRLTFGADGRAVVGQQVLLGRRVGRLRSVVEGPDGAIWLLTSNTDERGTPDRGDDRLLRVAPPRR
jgi:glucose/arabinose dehydrogenase